MKNAVESAGQAWTKNVKFKHILEPRRSVACCMWLTQKERERSFQPVRGRN